MEERSPMKEALFDSLTQSEWNTLLAQSNQFVVQAGGVVLEQGAVSNSIMILIEGQLDVCQLVDDKYDSIATLEAGAIFGEVSFFDGLPRSKSILAKTDVVIGEISQSLFVKFRIKNPHLASRFLIEAARFLATRFRSSQSMNNDLMSM